MESRLQYYKATEDIYLTSSLQERSTHFLITDPQVKMTALRILVQSHQYIFGVSFATQEDADHYAKTLPPMLKELWGKAESPQATSDFYYQFTLDKTAYTQDSYGECLLWIECILKALHLAPAFIATLRSTFPSITLYQLKYFTLDTLFEEGLNYASIQSNYLKLLETLAHYYENEHPHDVRALMCYLRMPQSEIIEHKIATLRQTIHEKRAKIGWKQLNSEYQYLQFNSIFNGNEAQHQDNVVEHSLKETNSKPSAGAYRQT